MKSMYKKIVALICSLFMFICSLITIFTFLKTPNDVDWACNQGHPLAHFFSFIYGKSNKVIGRKIYQDGEMVIYIAKNGHLIPKLPDYDSTENRASLSNFNSFLKSQGIDCCYVMTSESGDERLGQLPLRAPTNYCESVSTRHIRMLDELGIDYINTFDYLSTSTRDYYDYFYLTDHHWNDYAGLFVADIITKHLNTKYNYNLDNSIFDVTKYSEEVYEKIFLGSFGKKVGTGVVQPEDFVVLIPNFETNFKVSATSARESRVAPYRDSLLFRYHLPSRKGDLAVAPYCTYLDGDQKLMNIENLEVKNNKRILVLKDSKANVVNAHLAFAVQYLDIIDLRAYDGNLKNYIKSTKPDMVMLIQSPFATPVFYQFD